MPGRSLGCRLGMALLLLLVCVRLSAQTEPLILEIYPTYHQAHRVAAAVAPLLSEHESLTVHGNQLIIRATDTTHEKILELLNAIDRAPRRLLISLRQAAEPVPQTAAQTTKHLPDEPIESHAGVRIQRTDSPDEIIVYRGSSTQAQIQVQARAAEIYSTRDHGIIRQVQVMEGENAFVAALEQQPWQVRLPLNPDNPGAPRLSELRDGFHARPVLSKDGDIVVEINQQQTRRADAIGKTITTYQTLTTVKVHPGEWTTLSNLSTADSNRAVDATEANGVTHYRTRAANADQGSLQIRVDVLD